jgi:hypothetical protein
MLAFSFSLREGRMSREDRMSGRCPDAAVTMLEAGQLT